MTGTEPRAGVWEPYRNPLPVSNKVARLLWQGAYWMLFRFTPRPLSGWRRLLLRLFGARISPTAEIYSSARIWAPWNLVMRDHSCLAPHVECYNVALIEVGAHATVSQFAYLCGATHDYTSTSMPLRPKPIRVLDYAWVCAGAFIGPGVTVGEGAVAGARACVTRDVEPWTIVAGNPAVYVKRRLMRDFSPEGTKARPQECCR